MGKFSNQQYRATISRCNYMFTLFHFTPFGETKQAAVPIKELRGEVADRFSDWPATVQWQLLL